MTASPQRSRGSAEAPRQRATGRLYEFWSDLWKDLGRAPRVADIDLMRLYNVATTMVVQDVHNEGVGLKYRTRYWGSELTNMFGFEATAKSLGDIADGEVSSYLLPQFDRIVTTADSGVFRHNLQSLRNQIGADFEVMHVPVMNAEGSLVTQIISVFDFDPRH